MAMLAVAAAPASAQPPKLGPEFQVNAYTPGYQRVPDVAVDADGDFVVVWESDPAGFSNFQIKARRFDAAGLPLATEFRVRTQNTTYEEAYPAVAMRGDGSFVVVWQSGGNRDGDDEAIIGQRFSSSGARSGAEFIVNSTTQNDQRRPAIAIGADGGFFVSWEDRNRGGSFPGLAGRAFEANGDAVGPDFQINVYSSGQSWSAVAASASGDFMVVWTGSNEDGSNSGIFARRFGSSGVAMGGELQINSYTPGAQIFPRIAAAPGGDFRVVWESGDQDGYGKGVFARRLDAAGSPQSVEIQVNAYTPSHQSFPDIAIDPSGDFAIVWQSFGQDGSFTAGSYTGIIAQRFASDGVPESPEFVVNTHTPLPQTRPKVAMDGQGGMVVVWSSSGYNAQPGQDGSGSGIFGQRFGDLIAFDVDGNGSFGALTDALVLLRFDFGFRGAALVAGAVDETSCTRCTAEVIETFIPGLGAAIDIDDNGLVEPLADGLVTLRWAFGMSGPTLVAGVVGTDCTRCTAGEIDDYLTTWAD